jgi:hypothetical protein
MNWAFWISGALFGAVVVAMWVFGIWRAWVDIFYILFFRWPRKVKDDFERKPTKEN